MTKSIYEKTNFAMVQVVFITDYVLPVDLREKRVIAVVGGCTALGQWDPNDAPRGVEYPPKSGKWYITTWLPAETPCECKLALVSPGPGYVLWETGGNKHVPGRSQDGAVELTWGSDQPQFKTTQLPKKLGFCTILTRHYLREDMELKMVGSFHTIGNWNILKAPKTRLVPGTTDWHYACTALPKGQDIEWKWGVCRSDGSLTLMERFTNRFTLLNSQLTNNFLILAPWEVYALVMEIALQNRLSVSAHENSPVPSYDSSPGSGPGSSLPSPESFGEFRSFKSGSAENGNSGSFGHGSGGWYMGGRQCHQIPAMVNELSLIDQDIEHYRMRFPAIHTGSHSSEKHTKRKRVRNCETDAEKTSDKSGQNLSSDKLVFEAQNQQTPSRESTEGNATTTSPKAHAMEKLKTLTPQTIELLKTLIIAEQEDEKKENGLSPQGEKSPSRRASRVSPLPPIEEEEIHMSIQISNGGSPDEGGIQIRLHYDTNSDEESNQVISPEGEEVRLWTHAMAEPQARCQHYNKANPASPPLDNILPLDEGNVAHLENQLLNFDLEDDDEPELAYQFDPHEHLEAGSQDGESCYGSMASLESRETDRLGPLPPACEREDTETSPSSDEMNLECHNTLYGNKRVAKSCQEVSHWLLNYTQEPMKKSTSLDIGMKFPQGGTKNAMETLENGGAEMNTAEQHEDCGDIDNTDELHLEQNGLAETRRSSATSGSSRTTGYTATFPSGWNSPADEQFIQAEGNATMHAIYLSFTSACVLVVSSLFRNIMKVVK